MNKVLLLIMSAALFTGCAGIRETNNQFTTHAECMRVFGHPIPADDQVAAKNLVPRGANITNLQSSPADWTSVVGALGNIFSFNATTISGTK